MLEDGLEWFFRLVHELHRRGFSFGTHETTRRGLTFPLKEQCLAVLAKSKRWLTDMIGKEIGCVAAPGGFNAHLMKLANECGYTLLGTRNEWMNSHATMALPASVSRINAQAIFRIQRSHRS